MENRAHALAAGLFILLLVAAMVAAIVWFRGDHIERIEHVIVARTAVPGLALKAPVKLRGVDVGSVEAIGFDPADPRRIIVRIAVDRSAPLTRGTFAQLGYQGVTGLSFIALGDRGDDLRSLASAPEAERGVELRPSLLDQLASSGPALLASFSETANRLNALLEPQNQRRLERLVDSTELAVDRIGERAHELKPALAALPALLRNLDRTAHQAADSLRRAGAASDAVAQLASDLRPRLGAIDSVATAAARVEAAARALEIGMVGADPPPRPPLIDELGRAARGVDRALGQWSEQPHSLVFGRTPPPPGPGEVGFETGAAWAR